MHPLRDSRVAEINQMNTQYIGFYPMRWSFGEGILKSVSVICTNTKGQFIVGDWLDENIKVFDCDSNFLYLLSATLRILPFMMWLLTKLTIFTYFVKGKLVLNTRCVYLTKTATCIVLLASMTSLTSILLVFL